ncbi:MAG: hypothetical protein IPM39_02450 [Chloroflexi bacterium]|nr:hypothetical protein [Chloroflexota bacterium]
MSELETFVLGYLEEVGSLIEPPAFRVYEVLLPEKVAQRWQVDPYVQLAFNDTEREDVTQLGYNHPLVEQMVQEVNGRSASTTLTINDLRLDKTALDDLAADSWVILNARVERQKRSTVARVRSTYIRFNFKAAILTDDKQERVVSVLMDAHTGSRVANAAAIESQATAAAPDAILHSLPDAPIRWQPKGGPPLKTPLDEKTLAALLERAQTAVLQEMQTDLDALQKRVTRFRQLDEARLGDYYASLEKDLQTRLKSASADRRAALQDKLTAVQTERAHKLADLDERYQIRINLTLLNLLIIQQAKLSQPTQIANRTTSIGAHAVWDPLRRQLEPLHCHVCGQPGQRVYLCHNGHLAHENCLAPACIDCKRVFCQDCADEVGVCDVCQQPLCQHSRILCPDCGRYTCQSHRGLCHADNGRPLNPAAKTAPPVKEPALPPPRPQSRAKTPPPKTKPAPKAAPKPTRPVKGGPKPLLMEVVLHHNAVTAFMLGKREREIAVRTWKLTPGEGGILRNCECEKGEACPASGVVIRPFELQYIEKQIRDELLAFAEEYDLPPQKIAYNRLSSLTREPYRVAKYDLFGLWKNEAALTEARDTFARLYWK